MRQGIALLAAASCVPLATGCGASDGPGTTSRGETEREAGEGAAAAVAFRFAAGGADVLSVDSRGRVRVGTGAEPVDGRLPALVEIDGVRFGSSEGGSLARQGWFPVRRFSSIGTVPVFRSDANAFACQIASELKLLRAAVEDGRTSDLPAPEDALRAVAAGGVADGCRAKRAILCYLALWNAPAGEKGLSLAALRGAAEAAGAGSSPARSAFALALAQAAQKAAVCSEEAAAAPPATPSEPTPQATFSITANALVFSPSPLLSLSIYEGARDDYDAALVQALPVAFVAVPDECKDPSGICVASPWPASKCRKCDELQKGKTYTAFLLERRGQLRRDVKRVVFKR